ncbi:MULTISPECIES: UDP-N-acetylglucosamine 1-carboxyvinyltransferase [Enterococcus]|uniref:UDP-N-acetylglucosamine 1-carboxyvinyltransferase n=1 Tax=Enterococcus faecium TaxID=1352 RepID=A0A2G0E9N0_ENTFC|nr:MULTISPECIES: UDP-N-acetylglucosamine 1-carboxyvinyltransferase [Enterococcus]MBK4753050.1 UDP-N-acetylglucosamine 1-carboxyvinyltransferase [Enterococcus faecium]MBK4830553.1 UDP-N-acetylglucosamine 1-carboxyvinyltransferase [Enterococcus faecium]MBK4835583.1 UDP-N-acetylglucosamine 1-carboxyvinyltransferase [Enterococcus faecium]MBK4840044.1 UDP-N-acetylglucosamine 1-carboxyvinyltransferase [Enterococcus faecium]MBK4845447.1 UDP-N-acetylglucosamine 1-carboxyvinyltransferase [Enterococcus 
MKKIVIKGNRPLAGEVTISGAKNSAVALIPAAILADSPVILEGVPDIQDVHSLIEILEIMGATVHFSNNILEIDPREIVSIPMPHGKINSLRASYYFMGTLLGKFGEAVVGLPGGCYLGPRPIDLHVKGFESLGAEVTNEHGAMYLRTENKGLRGNRIFMDVVSVGATINVMLAAVKAKGQTVIENAAREPEIIDVATLLNNMGAKVRGAGTDVIRIEGVETLHGCRHFMIPDRIEAGTYLALAAAVGNGIKVKNVIFEHLESFIAKLQEIGVHMKISEDEIEVYPSKELKPANIMTYPYPGFATDLQQPLTALLLMTTGTSEIIDTIYAKRVNHVPELARMGADITVEGNMIIVNGPNKLHGTEVVASDLRAGACLVIAGLLAEGTTTIYNVDYILRGYDHIIEKLTALGASIEMIEEVGAE